MKKLLLGLVSILSIGVSQKASAQFSIQKDTLSGYASDYGFELDNYFINSGSNKIVVSWKIIYTNIPAAPSQWNASFGLCDNKTCYSNSILGGSSQITDSIAPGAANVTGSFHIAYTDLGSVSTYGPYYVTVAASDGTNNDTTTFVMSKFPTSVNNVNNKTSEVTIYPNPAANDLNVVFGNMDVKTIGVYNLIGKAVSYYRTSGTSAKLDLSAVPSGIYFLRLNDEQGRLVATRKFTKQ